MEHKNIDSDVLAFTTSLVGSGQISPDLATEIYAFYKSALSRREEYLVDGLAEKITKWETTMGDEDRSLYTLGMRHAIDFIRGIEPTVAKDYKPIGSEDYRNFKTANE
jgi:hypothetical protein